MNILVDTLPESVAVCGEKYEIRTDFRIAILFEMLMQDASIDPKDKAAKALNLFFPVIPGNLQEATKAMLWFYKCGKEENPQRKKLSAKKGKTRVYSFEYDDDYIYAAFMTQYSVDLQDIEYMHWWKFRAMFNSLTNQNEFVKIMEYRSIEIKSDMPKEQQSFYRKMKRLYALPNPGNEDEKLAEIEKALLKGGDLRGVL